MRDGCQPVLRRTVPYRLESSIRGSSPVSSFRIRSRTNNLTWASRSSGPLSAGELREVLEIRSNTLHYHLDELVDVGLVENRKRKEPDADGLYSYYRATSLGEGILTEGVRELMAREWDAIEEYS